MLEEHVSCESYPTAPIYFQRRGHDQGRRLPRGVWRIWIRGILPEHLVAMRQAVGHACQDLEYQYE